MNIFHKVRSKENVACHAEDCVRYLHKRLAITKFETENIYLGKLTEWFIHKHFLRKPKSITIAYKTRLGAYTRK